MSEKFCPKCESTLSLDAFPPSKSRKDGVSGYCRPCHNDYRRMNNTAYRDLSAEAKKKANCRSHTKMLVTRGTIVKPEQCSKCHNTDHIEAHHADYDQPRLVEWLCRPCHTNHHSEQAHG